MISVEIFLSDNSKFVNGLLLEISGKYHLFEFEVPLKFNADGKLTGDICKFFDMVIRSNQFNENPVIMLIKIISSLKDEIFSDYNFDQIIKNNFPLIYDDYNKYLILL